MVKVIKSSDLKTLQKVNIKDGAVAYAALKQVVNEQGILKRAYGFYSLLTLFSFGGFFLSLYYIVVTPLSVQVGAWAVLFAFFTVQVGGLVHDAGHKAVFKSTKMNNFFGNLCGALVVLEYNSWVDVHNKHHAHTNQEGEDPDIDLPLHGFTQSRFLQQKGIFKLLSKYQAYLYFPLRTMVFLTKRWTSIDYFKQSEKKEVWWQMIIWTIGIITWFVLPFYFFGVAKSLFLFFAVNIPLGFYMSNIFAPNHKGMPELSKEVKLSFLEHQVITTRNIHPHWLTDFMFMGLNYQIEHHLFPNCPRNKLKYITPYVKEICRKLRIEFTQVSVLESNKIILSELNKIARTTKRSS